MQRNLTGFLCDSVLNKKKDFQIPIQTKGFNEFEFEIAPESCIYSFRKCLDYIDRFQNDKSLGWWTMHADWLIMTEFQIIRHQIIF